jgi:hypothetical protein
MIAASPAVADRDNRIRIKLHGYEEVPSVSTDASGKFEATISRDHQLIEYELSYGGLQGTVTQAHIHFAQRAVNGGIVIWLCQTPGTPAPEAVRALTPDCPPSGTVTGFIAAASVLATTAPQQIAAGELDEVIAAMRAGVAYVNVHTSVSPGGEIRGQIDDHGHRH